MDDAIVGLLSKRAYDVAGCGSGYQGKSLKVYLNGTRIPVNSFQDVSRPLGLEHITKPSHAQMPSLKILQPSRRCESLCCTLPHPCHFLSM